MDTGHNHPPRCCCAHECNCGGGNSMHAHWCMARPCPLCPEHGELAQLGNTECSSCHQLPGRPPTDYCQMPAWHAARHIPIKTADHPGDWTATLTTQTRLCPTCRCDKSARPGRFCETPDMHDRFRTPGYDGPEGTEWPRHTPSTEHAWGNDTHYPPTGGTTPHHIAHCPRLGCPPRPDTPTPMTTPDDHPR